MRVTRRNALEAGAVLAALLVARGSQADADGDTRLARILGEVARARASLRTLTGPFTQTRTIGLLAAKVRSTGVLTLARPDRLRWQLLPPDDVIYWVTPDGLAYASKSGHGSMHGGNAKMAGALSDLRVLLGGDLGLLGSRYDLAVSGDSGGPVTFDASPKPGADVSIQHLTFALGADRVTPLSAVIVEGPRDKSEIVFGTLTRDAPVDPAVLRPPP
jgi:Outer membrane lipoprotein carrier protein LolA